MVINMGFNNKEWLKRVMEDPEQRDKLAAARANAVGQSLGEVSAPEMFKNLEEGDKNGGNNQFLTVVTSVAIKKSEYVVPKRGGT